MTPEQLVQHLRALRARIPELTALSAVRAKSLGRAAGVDPHAIQSAINAVDASDSLAGVLGTSAEELHEILESSAQWAAVVEELEAMLKGARGAFIVRRHHLGLIALQVYQISRQLARGKGHSDLKVHVAAMRQRFVARRRRRVTTAPPPPPPPALP